MRRALVLLCGLPVLVAACGSGGGDRLTQAEYVRRADAICARYNEDVKKLPAPKTPPAIVDYADKSLKLLDEALADERDLEPPEQLEAGKDRWLDRARIVRNDVAQLREAAKKAKLAEIDAKLQDLSKQQGS